MPEILLAANMNLVTVIASAISFIVISIFMAHFYYNLPLMFFGWFLSIWFAKMYMSCAREI